MNPCSLCHLLEVWNLQRYKSLFKDKGIDLDQFLRLPRNWFNINIKNAADRKILIVDIQHEQLQKNYINRKRKLTKNGRGRRTMSEGCNTDSVLAKENFSSIKRARQLDLCRPFNSTDQQCNSSHSDPDRQRTNSSGMEERHRNIFLKHLPNICNIGIPFDIEVKLLSKFLLSTNEFEDARANSSSESTRKMLFHVMKAGPNAFYDFKETWKDSPKEHIAKTLSEEDIKSFAEMLQQGTGQDGWKCEPALDLSSQNDSNLYNGFLVLTKIHIHNFKAWSSIRNIIDCRIFEPCKSLISMYIHQNVDDNLHDATLRNIDCLPLCIEELYIINFGIDSTQLIKFLENVHNLTILCISSRSSIISFDSIVEYVASTKKAKQILLSHVVDVVLHKRQTFFIDERSTFHPDFVDYKYYFGFPTPACKSNLRYFAFRMKKNLRECPRSLTSNCNWKRDCHDTNQMTLSFKDTDKMQKCAFKNDNIFPYNRVMFDNMSKISNLKLRYPEFIERLKFKHCNFDKESIRSILLACHNAFAVAVEGTTSILESFPEEFVHRITVIRLLNADQFPPIQFSNSLVNLEIMNSKDITINIEMLTKWKSLESLTLTEDAPIYPNMSLEAESNVTLSLKKLIIRNVGLEKECLSILLKSCPQIEVLHLKGDYTIDVDKLQELKHLNRLILRQVKIVSSEGKNNSFEVFRKADYKILPQINSLTLNCLTLESARNLFHSGHCCNITNLTLFLENSTLLKFLKDASKNRFFENLFLLELFVNLQVCIDSLFLPSEIYFPALKKLIVRPFFAS